MLRCKNAADAKNAADVTGRRGEELTPRRSKTRELWNVGVVVCILIIIEECCRCRNKTRELWNVGVVVLVQHVQIECCRCDRHVCVFLRTKQTITVWCGIRTSHMAAGDGPGATRDFENKVLPR